MATYPCWSLPARRASRPLVVPISIFRHPQAAKMIPGEAQNQKGLLTAWDIKQMSKIIIAELQSARKAGTPITFQWVKNTVVNGMHLLGLGPKATHCPPLLAFLEQLWANLTRGPVPKSTLLVAPTSIEIGSSKEHGPPTPVSASASCEDEDDGPSDRNQPKAAYVSDHPASAYMSCPQVPTIWWHMARTSSCP